MEFKRSPFSPPVEHVSLRDGSRALAGLDGFPSFERLLEPTQRKGLGEFHERQNTSLSKREGGVEGLFVMCLSQAEA